MIIIGIDPGSRFCGYGLLEINERRILAAGCDVINLLKGKDLPQRLEILFDAINDILREYKPDLAVVESIFYHKQIRSVFTLGQARGVILLALAQNDIPIVEYSPREVKKAVVGNGNASKQQVRYMVNQIVNLHHKPAQDDAYDALGLALCHYHRIRFA
ncbi:MAG TPA: crossover junction endodeoxyribonuclease RuvC [Candidatus Syntrophosphaera thermopropionivorans]|nr:crossover junction endodeoxyribonuclease RuvC [Candidatus Syntrophosphaera thermopropionivorans]